MDHCCPSMFESYYTNKNSPKGECGQFLKYHKQPTDCLSLAESVVIHKLKQFSSPADLIMTNVPWLILPSFANLVKWWTRFTLAAWYRCSGVSCKRRRRKRNNLIYNLLLVTSRIQICFCFVFSDLVDDPDELHWGERFSCSLLNSCQDLLLSLVTVADVVSDFCNSILNHGPMTCSEDRRWKSKTCTKTSQERVILTQRQKEHWRGHIKLN